MSAAQTGSDVIDLETASPAAIRRFLRPEPKHHTGDPPQPGRDRARSGRPRTRPPSAIVPNQDVLHQVVTAQLAAASAGRPNRPRPDPRSEAAGPGRSAGEGADRARQGSDPLTRGRGWGRRRSRPRPAQLRPEGPPRRWCSSPSGPPLSDRANRREDCGHRPVEPRGTQDEGRPCRPLGLSASGAGSYLVLGAEDGVRRPVVRQPRRRPAPSWSASSTPTTSSATTGSCPPTPRFRFSATPGRR